jgi:LuxR family maltose regulon positive regulatory protein
MKAVLQKTKLYFPTGRAQLVDRPRLVDQLNTLRSPGHRIGLISAPAGTGKTTLVTQWLANMAGWRAGWVSLDTRDNQPARFFTYFIAAWQTLLPEAGKDILELLQLPGVNLEEVVTLLVNDLAEASSPLILVLDDFHTITNPVLHQAIDLFLDAQLPQMRLLLLSREDPALQLARHRASGQLVEIRQDDLRFTLAEALDFLNRCMGLHLTPAQVEILEARTEGWIAGLQMAALALQGISLQHSPDVDGFIRKFSGSHRFILDYLMEEVLSHQPQDIQDFLLETSILERMCAGLCAAVTQKTASVSQKLLESLARANLFVISLDEERCWYRYHHLFNDLLLARFQGNAPERAALLCQRASDWYEDHSDPRLAVEYALKAHNAQGAAVLIERHFAGRWQAADLDFLFLIDRLPMEVIARRPSLCLDSAGLWVLTGQYGRVLPFLEAAERCLADPDRNPEPTDAANRVFAKTLRAFLDGFQNQPVQIDEPFQRAFDAIAFDAIPEAYTATRSSVAVLMEAICYMEGDFTGVLSYCQDAIDRDKRVNGTIAIPISVMRMVWVLQAQGKLRQALDIILEYEAYVRLHGSRRFYISGVLYLMWGDILYEWNRLDEAEAQIRLGQRLLEDWPIPQPFTLGLSLLARLQMARGDISGARAALQKAEGLFQEEGFHPTFVHALQKAQVHLWMAEHNDPALELFVQKTAPLAAQELSFRHEAPLVELCRVWIASGRSDDAAALLKRLAGLAGERPGSRLAILTLLATAQRDQPALAKAALEEALRLGELEGYLRTFVDAGEPLRQVLNAWVEHPRSERLRSERLRSGIPASLQAYAWRVLTAFQIPSAAIRREGSATAGLPEPLTPRELDVLRLLVEGCSNKQIAEQLILAEGTVKFYVHGILEKLQVRSRTQAAARARDLNL